MEISFCSRPNTNKVIATIFGTWHDSWAVVACAKFCCDVIISNWIRAKWNFHHIWIVMEKSLVKWVPEPLALYFIDAYVRYPEFDVSSTVRAPGHYLDRYQCVVNFELLKNCNQNAKQLPEIDWAWGCNLLNSSNFVLAPICFFPKMCARHNHIFKSVRKIECYL